MIFARLTYLVHALVLTAMGCGCVGGRAGQAEVLSEAQRIEIYERWKIEFSEAVLFKPREGQTNSAAFQFAPLIVRETAGGAIEAESGQIKINLKVFFRQEQTVIQGRSHDQFTYVWSESPSNEVRGIRITVDSKGQPFIWEILGDDFGVTILTVSQSLETAAARIGPALPGRRFAIERGLQEASGTVVARVTEDSPAPMGPIVHVRADGEIATVICRCMAPQFKKLAGEGYFEIVPQSETRERLKEREKREGTEDIKAPESGPLEQRLRLPAL